jgi:holo-[acyl-carrier-protein] synthase
MIIGVGTDVLKIERISSTLLDQNDPFIRKTFTKNEIKEAEGRGSQMVTYFAARFAAKEAVFKAFDVDSDSMKLSDIETLDNKNGKPEVNLLNKAAQTAQRMGVKKIHISISKEDDIVVAFVVVCND